MQQNSLPLKRINTLYFIAIVFIGIYFGKERAIFCDSAMQLFGMATSKTPSVNINMSTTVINFVLPYIATLLGLSLKIIVWSLAINYLLLPIFVFLFLRYKQSSLKYEIAFLVSFSIFNCQTFYYPIHDYWTGFYLLFILYRILDDSTFEINETTKSKFVYLLIVLIIFTHLSMVISIGFLFLYLFLEKIISLKKIVQLYLFIVLVLLIKILFINSGYQNNVIDIHSFQQFSFHNIINAKSIAEFFPSLYSTNLNFTVLFVASVILCIRTKQFLKGLLMFVILVSSILVIYLLFGRFGYSVYTEGYFKSLNIVTGILIADILFTSFKKSIVLSIVASVIYVASIFILHNGGLVFKKQYDFVNNSCKKFKQTVYLKSNRDICPLEYLAVSRQSLIINQIENNNANCIFTLVRNEYYVSFLNNKWIDDNRNKPVEHFIFDKEIKYLDADSMQYPIDSLSVIFGSNKCDDFIKRLSP